MKVGHDVGNYQHVMCVCVCVCVSCIQGNSIRAAGLKVIGTVLKRNQKLQVLDVSDNDIGEVGAAVCLLIL